ncbi:MAG: hypothetical protein QY318_04060 [Candidatus Dojkabacteria bacterium]|nr:MAG: hypothetical protein QY318_04060 [Candidatus Dojkabacteria bacterium]
MCLFFIILLFGPRLGLLSWWLVSPARFNIVFETWIWPFIGLVFLPWTTLMYVAVGTNGVVGFDWVWLGLALLADIASYSTSGYSNRDKIPGYSKTTTTTTTTTAAPTESATEVPAKPVETTVTESTTEESKG